MQLKLFQASTTPLKRALMEKKMNTNKKFLFK